MKAIKHYLTALALLFIALPALTSCGNDDEEKNPLMPINDENSFVGTTTTWPSDNPESKYTSTKSVYNVVFDTENKIASLVITDADFLEGMPSLQPMTFPGISYTVGETAIILNCASLTPTIGGRPFSAFPITGLQAKLVTDTSFDLQFICSYRGTPYVVSFKGRPAE